MRESVVRSPGEQQEEEGSAGDGAHDPGVRTAAASVAASPSAAGELIGSSEHARALRARIAQAASSDSTVLITGETGTGKNLVAAAIHRASQRNRRPFVAVDCAALSPTLVESELFGHERGAFTGALARRAGRFERAGEGTLLLDEIGELEPRMQSKLLRVLEEREFETVGGVRAQRMRARVLAATSRVLEEEVAEGRFRPDLFYRLHIVRVHVPPLRERNGDIDALAREAVRRAAARMNRPQPPLDRAFLDVLAEHEWPGNVRELVNLVEAAFVLSSGAVLDGGLARDLLALCPVARTRPKTPPRCRDDARLGPSGPHRVKRGGAAETERARLAELLIEAGGNVARVARKLGMPRSTLRYRLQRQGLEGLVPRE